MEKYTLKIGEKLEYNKFEEIKEQYCEIKK
jgi:hypothetical protein